MENEELIQKYFLNQLSPEELDKFLELKEQDSAFREQLSFEEDLRKAIQEKERASLKQKLNVLEAELPPLATKRKLVWTPLRIAASVLILLGLGYFVFKPGATETKQLYASNYELYPNTVYTITRSDTTNSLERKAFVAYESEDFETAIPLLEQLKQDGDKNYMDFYLGQAYLKTNRPNEAIGFFQENLDRNEVFVPESQWYLALAYLNLGEVEKSKEALIALRDTSNYKKEVARQLLSALD